MWIKGAKNEIHKKNLKKRKKKEKIKQKKPKKQKQNEKKQTIFSDKNWKFNLTYFLL